MSRDFRPPVFFMIRNHGKKSRNTVPLIYDIFPELGSLDLTRPNSSQASRVFGCNSDDLCPLNAPHEVYYFFLKQKTYFLKQKVLPKLDSKGYDTPASHAFIRRFYRKNLIVLFIVSFESDEIETSMLFLMVKHT